MKRGLNFPSLTLVALAAFVVARSLAVHNYTRGVVFAQKESYGGVFALCCLLAALLAFWPAARRAIVGHFEQLSRSPKRTHILWIALAYAGAVVWLGFQRFCQIRGFQMPPDTANSINAAYGFIRHGVLEFTPYGVKSFAVQPLLLMAVYSPALLVWNSPLSLYFLQHALVCSAPFAAYALTFALTSSSLAGFVALVLALANPTLFGLVHANLTEAALGAIVIWGLYFLHIGRRGWAGAFLLLALCCSWEVPFVLFGLGLYLVWTRRRAGFIVCAAAAVLWLGELAVVHHYQSLETGAFALKHWTYWTMFSHLAPIATPADRIPAEIFGHPFRTAGHFLHPYVFLPFVFLLGSTGFLSLLAPTQMIPLLFAALPHVLGVTSPGQVNMLSTFFEHNGASVYGLLLFATAYGIRRGYSWLAARDAQGWLLVFALLVAAFNISSTADTHATLPDWRPSWFDAMPRVMGQIPPRARVWADDYAAAPLANRRWIKALSFFTGQWYFGDDDHVFKPDYVLLEASWLDRAERPFSEKIMTYLSRSGFAPIAADTGIILWKSPEPSSAPEETPDWIRLPEADPAAAASFARAAKDFAARQDKSRENAEALRQRQDDGLLLQGL